MQDFADPGSLEISVCPTILIPMPSKPHLAFVWPKDSSRSRFLDCCRGTGPDIFVGRLDSNLLRRSQWSRWANFFGSPEAGEVVPPPIFYSDRRGQVYDFRTRKYAPWSPGMLSDVRYFGNDPTYPPMYFADAFGRQFNIRERNRGRCRRHDCQC